jgi:hypothetical protein
MIIMTTLGAYFDDMFTQDKCGVMRVQIRGKFRRAAARTEKSDTPAQ